MEVEPAAQESRGQEAEAEACDQESSKVGRRCRAMRRASQTKPAGRTTDRNEPEKVSDPRMHEA